MCNCSCSQILSQHDKQASLRSILLYHKDSDCRMTNRNAANSWVFCSSEFPVPSHLAPPSEKKKGPSWFKALCNQPHSRHKISQSLLSLSKQPHAHGEVHLCSIVPHSVEASDVFLRDMHYLNKQQRVSTKSQLSCCDRGTFASADRLTAAQRQVV